jgi:hypothetical protein
MAPSVFVIITEAVLNACDFAVLGMGISTSLGWWVCMRRQRKEEEELKLIMAAQGFKPMAELEEKAERK